MENAELAPCQATQTHQCSERLRDTVLPCTPPGSSFVSAHIVRSLPVPEGGNMGSRPDGELSSPVSVPRRRNAGRRPPHRKSDKTKPISFFTEVASPHSVNLDASGNVDAKQTQFHWAGARLRQGGEFDEPGSRTSGISQADRPTPAGSPAGPTLGRRRDLSQNEANLIWTLVSKHQKVNVDSSGDVDAKRSQFGGDRTRES